MRFQHKPRIYIAGPYSAGDPQANTDHAIDVADQIVDLGGDPFIPHLSHYRHARHERPYQFWIDEDLRWLEVCDALFRFEGRSSGADNEGSIMHNIHHRPVFYYLDALRKWIITWNLAGKLEQGIARLDALPELNVFRESERAGLQIHLDELIKELDAA